MSQAVADRGAGLKPLAAYGGTLSQRTYAALKEAILDLTLRPGEIIRKGEVCEALGVSRSPVSEALARLAAEALVDVVPQAGTFVARLSMEEVREGAFLREALELHAVEAVARGATPEQVTALRRSLMVQEALVAAGDAQGFYAEDARMHEAILGITGHRRLPALSRSAWVHVDRARRLVLPEPGRVAETVGEHRAIVEAIAAQNPAAAREATRLHLGQLVTRLEGLARERPDLFS
jgi:DNA-binding GntR family transcriptional regulator